MLVVMSTSAFSAAGISAALPGNLTLAETPTPTPQVSVADGEPAQDEAQEGSGAEAAVSSGLIQVTGVVQNLSGGSLPAGLQVTLQGYESMSMMFTRSTEIAADGSFSFDSIEITANRVLLAFVEYEGITYGSDVLHLADFSDGAIAQLNIAIYEKSSQTSGLYADRAHIFLEFLSANRLQVIVYLLISNPTSYVIAGEEPDMPALTFVLPEEAANLQFEDADASTRFVALEGGFGDLMSVRPGLQQHEILYAFELPYDGKSAFNLTFPLDVNSGTIVAQEGLTVQGDQLQPLGERQMEGGVMQLFNTANLPAGTALRLKLSGKAGGEAAEGSSNLGLAVGLGAFALVLLGSGLWLSRRPKAARVAVEAPPQTRAQTEESLLDEIIALDRAYEAGDLTQEQYVQKREGLKELLKLTQEKR